MQRKAYFHFDNVVGWLQVRCQAADKKLVLKNYLEIQSEIEYEIKDQEIMQSDGSLSYDMQNLLAGAASPNISVPDGMIELEVPTELSRFKEVVAWQDLQPQYRIFSSAFLMAGAYNAIEEAHGAKLHIDEASRVIFVGAASKAAVDAVKAKLTTLLRCSVCAQNLPAGVDGSLMLQSYGRARLLVTSFSLRKRLQIRVGL